MQVFVLLSHRYSVALEYRRRAAHDGAAAASTSAGPAHYLTPSEALESEATEAGESRCAERGAVVHLYL